jgi:hypothetical protein
MPIAVAAKVSAMLDGLSLQQLNELSPAERRRFAELCFHWSRLADRPRGEEAKAGVLSELRRGERGG